MAASPVDAMARALGPACGVDEQGHLPLPWLADALRDAHGLARSHALLVHGPAGAGQLELGLVLAQGWLCEGGGGLVPCGRCASCHLVRTRVHPDLLIVVPDALRLALGWSSADEAPTKSDSKPSRDVRVQQVRQAIDWAHNTSGRGRGKVLVLHPADALNLSAANALLKTLEEPPGMLRLVLTSSDPERLLPTIRSRCQKLPLALPEAGSAQQWLAGQGLADAGPLLALSGGSPIEALGLAAEGIDAGWLQQFPRSVAQGDASLLRGRPIPRVIDLLGKLVHDAMAVSVGAPARFFPTSPPRALSDRQAWNQASRELFRMARREDHPWNAPLLIEALVTQVARLWQGGGSAAPRRPGASLHSRR